jgi:hypothetical protein
MKTEKLLHGICVFCGEEISYKKKEKPSNCPKCGGGNDKGEWKKPPTETILFTLQREYFKNKNVDKVKADRALSEMYLVLKDYAEGKIKKLINGKVFYSEDKIEEKAIDIANCMIDYYLSKEGFRIDNSFGGYLDWQIKSVIFNISDQEEDQVDSLNDHINDTDKEMVELSNFSPVFESGTLTSEYLDSFHHAEDLKNGILRIIDDVIKEIQKEFSPFIAALVLIGISHYVAGKSEDFKNKYYQNFGGNQTKLFVDQAMALILEFIKTY